MTRIKGYYTMEELAKEVGISYWAALGLAKMLGFRKLGKLYLVSQIEVNTITNDFEELRSDLLNMREND